MKHKNEIIRTSSTYGLVKAIKALKTVTRIRMINLLIIKECCVCEVSQALQISQTAASRNLNILLDAGFIKMRKEGLKSIYSLDKNGMPDCLSKLTKVVKLAQNGKGAYSAADRTPILPETRKRGLNC